MSVTVWSKPGCVQCDATTRALRRLGVEFREVDVSTDAAARDLVAGMGFLQAPVVQAGSVVWSGYRPDRIEALAGELVG
ncbi:glutaredoxin domain-containing protein [uncultured Cellulomonas sp.]|uniref:glutaredoxin domain-containing protein n=1 Tax=uncultured Cellulomonas sp. TaxID=189682 RepID=UPI00261A486C|nr:glutaredoxin domain-containing protein [uncultured Cellulomonas sp.]